MSNELQTQQKGTVRVWAQHPEYRKAIGDSLAGWMGGDEFIGQLLASLTRDDLRPCTEESKLRAMQTCAALALIPSMQHVALIPRKNRDRGVTEVTVMPQWQGLKSLMERHPEIEETTAHLVHVTDILKYNSTTKQVEEHVYNPLDPNREIKKLDDILGGYLEVKYRDRSRPSKFHFVPVEKMKKARGCAQTQDVWNKWTEEQALKTVYRNAYARRVVPIDPLVERRLQKATELEDEQLGNDPTRITDATVIQQQPAPQLSRTQQLAQQFAPVEEPASAGGPIVEQASPSPPTKRATGRKRSEEKPEPSVEDVPEHPDFFAPFVVDLQAAKNATQVMAAWNSHISTNDELLKADREFGDKLRDWRLGQLGKEPPKGKLFEDAPQYQ